MENTLTRGYSVVFVLLLLLITTEGSKGSEIILKILKEGKIGLRVHA